MATNPFPSSPPQYVRARLYDYKFTSFAERRSTGNWWRRESQGEYFPVVSRKLKRDWRLKSIPRTATPGTISWAR